mgnify:CR=1 FL=1
MQYLATIVYGNDETTMMFKNKGKAQQWLDENNNNLEHTTIISEYDDNWNFVSSYEYTKGKEQ